MIGRLDFNEIRDVYSNDFIFKFPSSVFFANYTKVTIRIRKSTEPEDEDPSEPLDPRFRP